MKTRPNGRAIKDEFLNTLKESAFLKEIILLDQTLDLELRGDHVTIYYRGCNILEVKEDKSLNKSTKYLVPELYKDTTLANIIPNIEHFRDVRFDDIKGITEYLIYSKFAVDLYISGKAKNTIRNDEKEVQQRIVYENNLSSVAPDTDYYIIDIEYSDSESESKSEYRFDIVALQWASASNDSSKPETCAQLAVFELKYGNKSIGDTKDYSSKGSISQHYNDFKPFYNSTDKNDFKEDMLKVFTQKCELNLFKFTDGKNKHWHKLRNESVFEKIPLEFGFILANYKKKKKDEILKTELNKIKGDDFFIMESSFMGYGLYLSDKHDRKYLKNKLNR